MRIDYHAHLAAEHAGLWMCTLCLGPRDITRPPLDLSPATTALDVTLDSANLYYAQTTHVLFLKMICLHMPSGMKESELEGNMSSLRSLQGHFIFLHLFF